MQTEQQWQLYQELEFNIDTKKESSIHTLASWIRKIWQFISEDMNNREPQIWQRLSRDGTLYYYAYDPISGRSLNSASEDEVRMWLEELPYFRTPYL